MKGKDLLSVADLTGEEIHSLICEAEEMKGGWLTALDQKVLALIFEKPSLRTRVSFEVAMKQLGGHSLYLSPAEVGLGKREAISDVARVLSRYVDVIVARTFSHQTLESLGKFSDIPVINALSDVEHPCQALADLLTIYEKKGELKGLTLAYIGDGNNVANSLMLAASLTGINFRIASPQGYTIPERVLETARGFAAVNGAEIVCTDKPEIAARNADVVYTDVWTSMGQEAEAEVRRKVFAGYQVDNRLMALAREDALFMHPLPAHYGEEVAEGMAESRWSVIYDQAENRMHIQKAILVRMLGGLDIPIPRYR